MSGLRTLVQSCDTCSLCHNMSVSPVAIEYFGELPIDVLIVVGVLVKTENDVSQEVVMGPNREILRSIFEKYNLSFATTFLVKCKTDTKKYNKGDIKRCNWLKTEISTLKPKWKIGMGDLKYSDVQFDLITHSPHTELGSAESIKRFCKKIESLIK